MPSKVTQSDGTAAPGTATARQRTDMRCKGEAWPSDALPGNGKAWNRSRGEAKAWLCEARRGAAKAKLGKAWHSKGKANWR
jgi:hypothetical protein